MQITYLGQSGFLLRTEEYALLFDYYKGTLPELPADIPLYVFASHQHYDHFRRKIFSLVDTYPKTRYILSEDIRPQLEHQAARNKIDISPKLSAQIHYMKPDEHQTFPHFDVSTTDSTDEGVSFLLTMTDGKRIFHAGDLNWWTWIGEETPEEYEAMTAAFKKEVAKLKGNPIDIAFLPLDPRQQERFCWGFDYYMKELEIAAAYPMHFWDDPGVINRLLEHDCTVGYRSRIHCLRSSGDTDAI